MKLLPVSTAATLLIGQILDDDGLTPYTAGLAAGDVYLWKEGGSSIAAKNESNAPTHLASGFWTCPLNTTDTGTLGKFSIIVIESGCLTWRSDYMVVPNLVYNALINGTGNGIRTSVQDFAASTITASAIAADAFTAAKFATDVGTEIAAAVKALVVETNDSITLGEAMSVILAAVAGETTTSGAVFKDPSGTDTRITATLNGSNERTAIVLAPSA